jgi:hypothetical protein
MLSRETLKNAAIAALLENEDVLKKMGVELLRTTLFISTSQSMCGNCGGNALVGWQTKCSHCDVVWTHVTASYFASGFADEDYEADCEAMTRGRLKYVGNLGSSEPSSGWLDAPLRVRDE